MPPQELKELGYVAHKPSYSPEDPEIGNRKPLIGPLVEVMITTEASGDVDDPKAEQDSRELDAEQLALRINSLVDPAAALTGSAGVPPASSDAFTQVVVHSNVLEFKEGGRDARAPSKGGHVKSEQSHGVDSASIVKYSDIALLFRAMTNIQVYESAFRRAGIPYQTVLGRGFYERPEITDLIQLLRFLDNKTEKWRSRQFCVRLSADYLTMLYWHCVAALASTHLVKLKLTIR